MSEGETILWRRIDLPGHELADRYVYESAGGAFRRELQVDAFGGVIDYPGIWRAEATTPAIPLENKEPTWR